MQLFEDEVVETQAWLLASQLDWTHLDEEPLPRNPWLRMVGDGYAAIFRFGAVVCFGPIDADDRDAFFERLLRLDGPIRREPADRARLGRAHAQDPEGVDDEGMVRLLGFDAARLRVIAEILARSAILAHYEETLGRLFVELEPPIERLRAKGRLPFRSRDLLRRIGDALETEIRMVGRAEVAEKPEFLWEDPALDRLYSELSEEYELVDRDRAIARKLDLVLRAVSALLDALGTRRMLRVEWAIVWLIVVEIVLMW